MELGLRLLAALREAAPRETIVLSPLGLHAALAAVRDGARGATRAELDAVLDGGADLPAAEPAVELLLAAAVFVDAGHRLGRAWADAVDAEVRALDFHDPGAPAQVNAWAAERTRGMVPAILERFDPDEALAILTAAFFQGSWSRRFDARRTAPGPFLRADGSTATVPMMTTDGGFEYHEAPGLQAVRLPYGDARDLALIVVVDPQGTEAPRLDAGGWRALRDAMAGREGSVALPRVTASSRLDLVDVLKSLGVRAAFEPGHDLDALLDDPAPKGLGRVLQRARLEIDEQGTRAAAVTAVTVRRTSAPARRLDPFRMTVDRPFLWAIEDRRTASLAFLGVVCAPDPSD